MKEKEKEDMAPVEDVAVVTESAVSAPPAARKPKNAPPVRIGLPTEGRIHILRPGDKDLEFTGRLHAEVEEFHAGNPEKYEKTRWTRLSIYLVDNREDYVAVASHLPYTPGGAHPVYQVKLCATHEDLVSLFKHTPLAKKLYAKIGIKSSPVTTESLN